MHLSPARRFHVLAALFVLACTLPARGAPLGYQLVWNDEFTRNHVDSARWRINEPGPWGDAINTPYAVSAGRGALKITTFTKNGRHFSAVLGTQDSAMFRYGYFEARIRFAETPGAYSAFWMISPTVGDRIGDPERSGTEVDIVEHRAIDGEGRDLRSHVHSAVHWDGYGPHHKSVERTRGPFPTINQGLRTWNTYGLLWTPTGYRFYVDGVEIWSRDEQVSQVEQYLLLSMLVDDHSWAGDIPAGGYGTRLQSITNMQVDYVRVYQNPALSTSSFRTLLSAKAIAPEPSGAIVLLLVTAACLRRVRR